MSSPYGRKIIWSGSDPDKPLYLMDCFVYIAVDPSGGASEQTATSRTDKCGWAVVAVDVKDNRFVMEIGERHLTDEQFIEHVYQLHDTYLPRMIGIEQTPHLDAHFRRAIVDKKKILPITPLKPRRRKKADRIRSCGAALGRTYFQSGSAAKIQKMFRDWYDEMEHGDDGIDAFAYIEDILVAPTPKQIELHRKEIIKALDMVYITTLPKHVQEEWKFIKRYADDTNAPEKDYEDFLNGQ